MRSIRVSLTVWLLAGLGLTVVGVSLISHRLVSDSVVEAFDRSLHAKVHALATLVSFDEDGFELDLSEQDAREYTGGPDPEYLQIWVEGGPVVARSPSLGDAELPRRAGPAGIPQVWDLALPDGRPGRAVGLLTRPAHDDEDEPEAAEAPRVLIVTARSRAGLDATLAGVATVFVAGGALSLLLIVLIVHLAVRRALSPVAALGARLDTIDAASLSERLPLDGVPEELARIPPTLNALLDRLQLAFRRERRMTGNVAHELRTPLAELRTASELAHRWPEDEELRAAALATAHDVSLRMGGLVDALLRLSRVASGQAPPSDDTVALAGTLAGHCERLAARARERDQAFELAVPADLAVRTDRELLDVAVGNLLANAVQHGSPGHPIRCRAAAAPAGPGAPTSAAAPGAPAAEALGVRLTIENGAEGLTDADLPHMAEPFWCGDAARTDGHGIGLGLALADTVAAALGARLSFELHDGRLLAHLDLPSPPVTPARERTSA